MADLWKQPRGSGSARRHGVFFALKPDPPLAEALWLLADGFRAHKGLTGRLTPADRLHVSLAGFRFTTEPDPQVVARMRAAADLVTEPAFVVEFNRLLSWKGAPRPLVLTGDDGVEGIKRLGAALRAAMAEVGLAWRGAPAFEPHMTLLRDPVEVRPKTIPPVGWRVREFVLIHSPHGLGRHISMGRWALNEPDQGRNLLSSAEAIA